MILLSEQSCIMRESDDVLARFVEGAQEIALTPAIIEEAIRRLFAAKCTFRAPNTRSDLRGILRKVVHRA